MKVLVLGNSHAGCLMHAWKHRVDSERDTITFFVKSGSLSEFSIVESQISATSSEFCSFLERLSLATTVNLDAYDTIVIVGSELSIFSVVSIINRYRILDWPMKQDVATPALTEDVLRIALAEAVDQSSGGRILRMLYELPTMRSKKLIIVPQPFPSERALISKTGGFGFRRLIRHRAAESAVRVFNEELVAFCSRFGALYQPQPGNTIVHECFTANAYTSAARRLANLDQMQPSEDIIHANAAYGQLIINQILTKH